MDTLSDVLTAIRLTGAFFYRVSAAPPWSAGGTHMSELVSRIKPDADHLISYHVVSQGRCWGRLEGGEPILVEAGDVIVFPHGDAHIMSSAPDLVPAPYDGAAPLPRFPFAVSLGESQNEPTQLVCGFLACDLRPFNPLLAALPRVMHMRAKEGGWLQRFSEQVAEEARSGGSGTSVILTRLSELMFIEVVRRHVESLGDQHASWLAALRDPFVGRALGLFHERPAEPWTLADLARETALSRSALADRFTHYVGEPPMQYLARWRMQLASRALAGSREKVAAVAATVGYESEAAFSRAFKKIVGMSPAAWRDRRASL